MDLAQQKQRALDALDRRAPQLAALGDAIWDRPETSFEEHFAARTLAAALEEAGFALTWGLGGLETAFSAAFGTGGPTIGILGEYDALSGMSQRAGALAPDPLVPGGPGHGCGHNLLGVGSLGAALAVKEYLVATGAPGKVVYFGCPGEEAGAGKAFMARDGAFDGLDCALCWHPGELNAATSARCLANCEVLYRFTGRSSHAASAPYLGRSALDAVTLLNTGVQFLREHIIPEARVHYAVTDTGGYSPNVVQAYAEALYLIRAPQRSQVEEIRARVDDVARGAALMTGTQVECRFVKACSELIPNHTLAGVMGENLAAVPLPLYSEEELAFARAYCDTLPAGGGTLAAMAGQLGPAGKALAEAHRAEPIHNFVVPAVGGEAFLSSSTDVGDVSWLCPTAQIMAATMAAGTPGHSWQRTAQGKSSIAHKGTLYAAKVMAASAIDLLQRPDLLRAAGEEHRAQLAGRQYLPIPPEARPIAVRGAQSEN
ncbi:amidohydrolase [Bittarella massiliensis (ex Durand et al. 2017)]|uniref:amidohydrolase n=1 Tax=Bittarella massiliensis (ex Durand et al. 2017) TaxID=1720313 RepID=UPI00073EA5B6|nr:amidohydrolase [Bittarella massiliensis (ex Durand et al. 2017)]